MSFESPTEPVLQFDGPDAAAAWRSVDDRVMGGVSQSRFIHVPGEGARFFGVVALSHGGGFASVRSASLEGAFAGRAGVMLRVRGDGRTYKLCARTDADGDGMLYQARFTPAAGEWTELRVAFTEFLPTFRGRVIEAAPLTGDAVRGIGLLISDRQAGFFSLDVGSVEAF